jgi:NADPH-dependent glutamate synthase beta subunit-like oxidoreductase
VDGKTIQDLNDAVETDLSVEALAVMLVRGEFPENYDQIIREMSDDDFERLWETFEENRKKQGTTVQISGGG